MSTKTLIQTITVGAGGAASIDFTSIPATYDDLVLEVSGRGSGASGPQNLRLKLNGAVVNYSGKYLQGSGTVATSGNLATTYIYAGEVPDTSQTANVFNSTFIYFPNYLSGNYKSFSIDNVEETNAAGAYALLAAGLWADVSAINAISAYLTTGNFVQYSMASLYGIKNS